MDMRTLLTTSLVLIFPFASMAAIDVTLAVSSVRSNSERSEAILVISETVIGDTSSSGATTAVGVSHSNGELFGQELYESCEKKALLAATNSLKYGLRISSQSPAVLFVGATGVFRVQQATCELIVR
jgi:hypothetical protein